MSDEELYAHPGWRWCTFEGAREQVLALGLKTTFRKKLEWLEAAEEMALRFSSRAAEATEARTLPPASGISAKPNAPSRT